MRTCYAISVAMQDDHGTGILKIRDNFNAYVKIEQKQNARFKVHKKTKPSDLFTIALT
jgi:hypothetical protein